MEIKMRKQIENALNAKQQRKQIVICAKKKKWITSEKRFAFVKEVNKNFRS